ncbi:hypothetical protein SALBM135S_09843 [Streptomyces alboniger]
MTTDTEGVATEADEPTLTVDELAARAGVTVRTIRFYGTRGLLPPARSSARAGSATTARTTCRGSRSSRSSSTRA